MLQDPPPGREAGSVTIGECRGRRSGEKTRNYFGEIHPGEKISYPDWVNGCFRKGKCPGLILVPPNYDLYNRSSKALIKLLSEYTDKIEQYSIDEAFLDMTGCCKDPITTAYGIKNRVHAELGFTVYIGVSENKLLAKMASDFTKPNHVYTLWKSEISEKMWHLPVVICFMWAMPLYAN